MTAVTARHAYLDWVRGVAVLIMVEAHLLDAWTQIAPLLGGAMEQLGQKDYAGARASAEEIRQVYSALRSQSFARVSSSRSFSSIEDIT